MSTDRSKVLTRGWKVAQLHSTSESAGCLEWSKPFIFKSRKQFICQEKHDWGILGPSSDDSLPIRSARCTLDFNILKRRSRWSSCFPTRALAISTISMLAFRVMNNYQPCMFRYPFSDKTHQPKTPRQDFMAE